MILLLHRLEGLHQLHFVPPPGGIALGHTRESQPGSQCGCVTMAPSGKLQNIDLKTAPSSLSTAPRGRRHRDNGSFRELGQTGTWTQYSELTKNTLHIATNSASRP